MSSPASSLPDTWMQTLWTELGANYPGKWQRQFPTPPCPPDVDPAKHAYEHIRGIQAVWAKRLGHLQSNPKALRYALDNLPENPPTLPEFVALCNRRPGQSRSDREEEEKQKALPAPKPDPKRVQQVIAGIGRPTEPKDPLAWAHRLHRLDTHNGGRMEDGRPITLAQRQIYRQALRLDHQESTHA